MKNLRLLNDALLLKWKWLGYTAMDKPWDSNEIITPERVMDLGAAVIECSLGDGQKLKFWEDRWFHGCDMKMLSPNLLNTVRPATRKHVVAISLPDDAWMRDLRGPISVPAIVEAMQLYTRLRDVQLSDAPDNFKWRLEPNGIFSAASAYDSFFGRCLEPGAVDNWSSWAPTEIKIFTGIGAAKHNVIHRLRLLAAHDAKGRMLESTAP